ncbi:MAG: SdpI family protein [Myxococcota bacterium]|nr:SdpI family protein [Myxococcota bacterium]
MKTVLKITLILFAIQFCLAVFTGLSVTEIPLLPGGSESPGIWINPWIGALIYPGFTLFVLISGYFDTLFSRTHSPPRFDRCYPPFIYLPTLYVLVLQVTATLGGMNLLTPHISHFILISGVLLLLFGNILPRVPYKSLSGLPLPWIFNSEITWRKTHRITGIFLVGAGALTIMTELLFMVLHEPNPEGLLYRVSRWIVVCLVLFPFPYSYFIYKNINKSRHAP